MTPEQHRKMNALVAEKVMGGVVCQTASDSERAGDGPWIVPWHVMRDGHPAAYIWRSDRHGSKFTDLWHPSTDIADAWEVVEKNGDWPVPVLERVPLWTLTNTPNRDLRVWRFSLLMNCGLQWAAFSESAPVAICLAALKARGVDTQEFET